MDYEKVGRNFPFDVPDIYIKNSSGKLIPAPNNLECSWIFQYPVIPKARLHEGEYACIRDGALFKKSSIKKGKRLPKGFVACFDNRVDKHIEGWLPVSDTTRNKNMRSAFKDLVAPKDGVYVLVGGAASKEKGVYEPTLIPAISDDYLLEAPLNFMGLRTAMLESEITGILFFDDFKTTFAQIRLQDY